MAKKVKQPTLDIHGKPYNRSVMILVLLIGTFAGMLMQTSLGTAIPTLMTSFDINLGTAQQATTWFLLANGIMVPVSAFLVTRISSKWLYWIAYTLLFIGMAVSAFTPARKDMWFMFLIGRMLAAVAVGITMPLMQVIMVNIFPAEERGAAMGLNGLVIGLAPAIGPTLTGWILDKNHYLFGILISDSWRTIFYLPLIVLAVIWVLTPFLVKDVLPNRKMKLDVTSLILSVIGFGIFLWGFTNVASDGWGDVKNVVLPIVLGIVIIITFILRQLKLKDPFMDVRVFKNKQFSVTTLSVMMAMMAMMGVEMMLPTYLQNVHGLSPLDSGLMLLPGALMLGVVSPIAGAVYDRVGARRLALMGFTILALGTFPFMFLSSTTPDIYITALYALRMFGISMAMMPLTASAMSAVPQEEAAHATASNNTARQVASAMVVALLASVTQDIINNNQPAKHLQTTNPLVYANDFLQASMKGFHWSFGLGFGFAVLGIVFAFMLRKGKVIAGTTNNVRVEREINKEEA
ncbi:major facilitator superfamily transporter [Weissella oryzae SG25]|uniref:Major facilitator superfamily transporter n=1 Tax=Weissella oryzae (strain DSM 25784 / JCM 18191 / LMG 30913 / SG25) TaxID=1329250 RepID=A0A069CSL9_WEIOS|nr:MDR family MFS transporter [Weissella oryzae]GAK30479.1 major facilitator superfamily transporter [Weissella oryzae SG25]